LEKARKTTVKKDKRRRSWTVCPERNGSSLKPQPLSNLNLSATLALIELKDLVIIYLMSEKVEDSIRGRVVSQMQADLAPNQDSYHWRKIKLIVDQT